jgi:TorA maturation chaperone TorD
MVRKQRKPARVKAWVDPDMARRWRKFKRKFGYLFWIQSMNVGDDDAWYELIKGKEPDLSHEPVIPKTPEEYVEIAKNRREIYFQLFRGFTEPTRGLVEEIIDGTFSDKVEKSCDALFKDSRIEEGLGIISKFMEKFKDTPTKKLWDKLDREHSAVFYDGYFPWISTYESIYLSEKQTMGDVTQEVKDLYRLADLYVALRFGNDPPDDLKIEMEFMFRMCEEELKAWKAGDRELAVEYLRMQKEHLTKHMAEWIPYLCDDLIKEEFKAGLGEKFHIGEEVAREYKEGVVEMDFYRGLAPITKAVIEHDYNQVEAMIGAVDALDSERIIKLCEGIEEKDISKERFHLVRKEEMTEADKPYVPPHPDLV